MGVGIIIVFLEIFAKEGLRVVVSAGIQEYKKVLVLDLLCKKASRTEDEDGKNRNATFH
jgi:hypothetical protein